MLIKTIHITPRLINALDRQLGREKRSGTANLLPSVLRRFEQQQEGHCSTIPGIWLGRDSDFRQQIEEFTYCSETSGTCCYTYSLRTSVHCVGSRIRERAYKRIYLA